jgi:4-methylaminobutanoate oxidase (formaldehyde-forming)
VGELGWEITCRSENASAIYGALTKQGARPAGLFAQTSMRIEKGFCAMGHELDSDVTPIEAGLDFATRKSGGFIGAAALEEERTNGASPRVISLALDDSTANLQGHEPIYLDGEIIGQTTSCAFGYRINRPVALGSTRTPIANGTQVQIDCARTLFNATVTNGALFDPDGARVKGPMKKS